MDAPFQIRQGDAGRFEEGIVKLKAFVAAVLLLAPFPAAVAQQSDARAIAAGKVFDWCKSPPTTTVAQCTCIAGFFAGATEDDEFQLIGVLVPFIAPDGSIADMPSMQSAAQAHKTAAGMTDARFLELVDRFTKFGSLGAKSDTICEALMTRTPPATAQ